MLMLAAGARTQEERCTGRPGARDSARIRNEAIEVRKP